MYAVPCNNLSEWGKIIIGTLCISLFGSSDPMIINRDHPAADTFLIIIKNAIYPLDACWFNLGVSHQEKLSNQLFISISIH
jgi:hypothetical protein